MVLDTRILTWILILNTVWLAVVTALLIQSVMHYRRLTKNISQKDLKTILTQILSQTSTNQKDLKTLEKTLKALDQNTQSHIQKIGFIRFNPFSQTGGDQSFCLSLLDQHDSGLVLSSFHTRDTTRLYAKPVKKGKGVNYQLSKEEQKAINNAQ